MKISKLDQLTADLNAYCNVRKLPHMCAAELLADITEQNENAAADMAWLFAFGQKWDAAIEHGEEVAADVAALFKHRGYEVISTGGNCEAYSKGETGGKYVLVTCAGGASLPTDYSCVIGLYFNHEDPVNDGSEAALWESTDGRSLTIALDKAEALAAPEPFCADSEVNTSCEDSDENDREHIIELFEKRGYEVQNTGGGCEAYRKCFTGGRHVLVTDGEGGASLPDSGAGSVGFYADFDAVCAALRWETTDTDGLIDALNNAELAASEWGGGAITTEIRFKAMACAGELAESLAEVEFYNVQAVTVRGEFVQKELAYYEGIEYLPPAVRTLVDLARLHPTATIVFEGEL